MRALLIALVIGLVLLTACKQAEKLPDDSALEGVGTETGQEVLDENMTDIDADLGTVVGDTQAAAQVQGAVTAQEQAELDQQLADLDSMQADLDPAEFAADPTI